MKRHKINYAMQNNTVPNKEIIIAAETRNKSKHGHK